ncbi:unnamed protein product [Rotaria magnacalcarata]|uniref:Uncharacterized protein n=2 Tax=Rotaria magnacalcarata TaxID=392030 RepID=A0A815TZ04_9BILA|nr:unnamed protein product [Rotaria magnacalcarata]CAF2115927.1 unnamed protein product [Rotaria magnacalcarata]
MMNASFKIPKIKNDRSIATCKDCPAITMSQLDIFRIFNNLTILFIGDSSIRTLYRDFTKLFSTNRLLENTEATIQHGEYKTMPGEQRLLTGGARGTGTYKDIREYFCEFSSTRLIYIHLPTAIGKSALKNINYLEKLTNCTCIHAVILSSYHGDLNFAKLAKSALPFDTILNDFNDSLRNICYRLVEICLNKIDQHQDFIWMGPYPPNLKLNDEQQYQFNQIIDHTNKIVRQHDFYIFDRYSYWRQTHNDLLLTNSHYFAPKAVRLMTQMLAEMIGNKWKRSIVMKTPRPPIQMRPTPLQIQDLKSSSSSQTLKWPTPIFFKKRNNPIDYQKKKIINK